MTNLVEAKLKRHTSYVKYLGALFLGLNLLGLGCKSHNVGTSTKSLDNFSSSAFTFNNCSDTSDEEIEVEASGLDAGEFTSEVKLALNAVPDGLLAPFFEAPNYGKIKLSDNATTECSGKTPNAKEAAISCFKTSDSSPMTLFIQKGANYEETVQNINHATLRGFAYFFSQVLAESLPNSSITKVADEFAVRMLHDVDQKNGQGGIHLRNFSGMLPQSVLASNIPLNQRRQIYTSMAQNERKEFSSSVLAEVIDSLRCSDQTAEKFIANFPTVAQGEKGEPNSNDLDQYITTSPANVVVDEMMDGLLDGFSGESPQMGSESGGMNLWGRGPIRTAVWGAGRVAFGAGRVLVRGTARVARGAAYVAGRTAVAGYRVGRAAVQGAGRVVYGAGRAVVGTARAYGQYRANGNGFLNARRFYNGGGYVLRQPWFNPNRW